MKSIDCVKVWRRALKDQHDELGEMTKQFLLVIVVQLLNKRKKNTKKDEANE